MKQVKCKDCSATFNIFYCQHCSEIRCEKCHFGNKHACKLDEVELRAKIVELLDRQVSTVTLQTAPVWPVVPWRDDIRYGGPCATMRDL